MADSVVQAGWNIADRNKNYNTATDFDPTVNRWKDKEQLEEESKDKSQLSFTDMLGLMVTQFQNQSIDNQASTTDMMNQLVQMTTMQAMTALTTKMDEVALANVMSYSASLVGKEVTVGVWNEQTGKLEEIVGVVKGSGTYDGQQVIYLDNGKGYFLSDIMAVGTLPPKTEKPGEEGDGEGDKTEGTPGTGEGDSNDTTTKPPETEGSGDAGNSQDPDGAVG
jgi:flagellar basal-body rod modification protein FlgD